MDLSPLGSRILGSACSSVRGPFVVFCIRGRERLSRVRDIRTYRLAHDMPGVSIVCLCGATYTRFVTRSGA